MVRWCSGSRNVLVIGGFILAVWEILCRYLYPPRGDVEAWRVS